MAYPSINGVPPPGRLAPDQVQATPGASMVAAGDVGGPRHKAPVGWPAHGTVSYTKDLLQLLLLLLAVPWLVKRIVHSPKGASRAAAKHHLD